jgi:hypothetical protein
MFTIWQAISILKDGKKEKRKKERKKQTKTLLAPYDHITRYAVPLNTSQKQILIEFYIHGSVHSITICISNQPDVTFSKFFHFDFATLHVSGVPCPSSGVSLLHW